MKFILFILLFLNEMHSMSADDNLQEIRNLAHENPTKPSKMIIAFYNLLIILILLEILKSLLRKYLYKTYLFIKSDFVILGVRMNIYHLVLFCCFASYLSKLLYDSYAKRGVYGMGVCFGEVGMILLAFMLFPVTKLDIISYIFGWSFDKTIRIHRLCGWFSIWCIFLHFLIIVIKFKSIDFIFKWKGNIPMLPGTIALTLFVLVGLFSMQFVRRRHYKFFYFTHLLTLVALMFSYLHFTRFIYILLPSIVLYVTDKLVYLYQYIQKADVVSLTVIEDSQYNKLSLLTNLINRSSILKMVLKKKNFKYEAGQYVFLNIPSLSLMSHPFSIASDPSDETIVLYVKDLGEYTHRLIEIVANSSFEEGDIEANNHRNIDKSLIIEKLFENRNVRICGPYGNPSINFKKYKVLLFIGAGVGCVPIYSLFSYLAHHSAKREYKNVTLIWTFRGECLYKEWKNDLKSIVSSESQFHVYLHCTKGNENLKDETDFPISFNRPNLKNYLSEIKTECERLNESDVGIYISGNDEIVNEVINYTKKENVKALGKFRYDVDNETFHF